MNSAHLERKLISVFSPEQDRPPKGPVTLCVGRRSGAAPCFTPIWIQWAVRNRAERGPLYQPQHRVFQEKEDSKQQPALTKRCLPFVLRDYPDMMDIGRIYEVLGVTTKTGYKLPKNGEIEYLKIQKAYRIPKAHIPRYLKSACFPLAE